MSINARLETTCKLMRNLQRVDAGGYMGEKDCAVSRAAYATVHQEGRTAKAIAADLGLSHQVLLNKVSPTNTSHFLRLTEAVGLMRTTRDVRILHALAGEMGGQYLPGPDLDDDADPALMKDLARMTAEFGELMKEVAMDMADGIISDNELARIEDDADQLRKALDILLRELRRLNVRTHNIEPISGAKL